MYNIKKKLINKRKSTQNLIIYIKHYTYDTLSNVHEAIFLFCMILKRIIKIFISKNI